MDAVGIELATVIMDIALCRASSADFARIASRLHRIGGSNAQRDVFVRTLAALAAERSNGTALERILAMRRRMKRDDRFASLLELRVSRAPRRKTSRRNGVELP